MQSKQLLVRFLEDSISEGSSGANSGFRLMTSEQYEALIMRLQWEFQQCEEGGYSFEVEVADGTSIEYETVEEVFERLHVNIMSVQESQDLQILFGLLDEDSQFGAFPRASDKYEN